MALSVNCVEAHGGTTRIKLKGREMLKGILKGLLMGFTLMGLVSCGDYLPLSGGALTGQSRVFPNNWIGVAADEVIQLETQGDGPYSVNLWTVLVAGNLHVFAGDNYARWVENIEQNAAVRLQADNLVYALRAERVTDPVRFEQFAKAWEAKYGDRPQNEKVEETYLFQLTGR